MIGRFLDAGHRAGWVAADEVYGGNPQLCSALEERQVGYVIAVACRHEAPPARDVPRGCPGREGAPAGLADAVGRGRTTAELAYYRYFSLDPAPQNTLVRVAGSRWRVEGTFQSGDAATRPEPKPAITDDSRESDMKITIYGWSTRTTSSTTRVRILRLGIHVMAHLPLCEPAGPRHRAVEAVSSETVPSSRHDSPRDTPQQPGSSTLRDGDRRRTSRTSRSDFSRARDQRAGTSIGIPRPHDLRSLGGSPSHRLPCTGSSAGREQLSIPVDQ